MAFLLNFQIPPYQMGLGLQHLLLLILVITVLAMEPQFKSALLMEATPLETHLL